MQSRDNEVVLFESKVHHPHHADVIGDDVEFVTFEESQAIDEPLYRPAVEARQIATRDLPSVTFHRKYQESLLQYPNLIRNVALVGHVGHGKTSLVDMLVHSTHASAPDMFTSTHHLEISRGNTLSAKVVNLVLPDSREKSISASIIDTPGHPDFWQEMAVGISLADTVLLVVDVCEPLLPTDLKALEQTLLAGKQLRVCFNKIDRLVVEQQRNPNSAATRLFYILDQVNKAIAQYGGTPYPLDQVLFASSKFKWCFTLNSIGLLYSKFSETSQDITVYLTNPKVFSTHALEPIFKIFYAVLSGEKSHIAPILETLGASYLKTQLSMPADDLLTRIFQHYFVTPVSALVDILPPKPVEEPVEPLMHIIKYVYLAGELYALVKIVSGSFSMGDEIQITDLEGPAVGTITGLFLPHTQYNMQISSAYAGNIVLVGGISDLTILDGAFAVPVGHSPHAPSPLAGLCHPIFKVGVESFDPEKTPIFLENLELLKRTWPGLEAKVEGTGEHLLCGSGELYLDSVLYSLRNDFQPVQVRVSDPVPQFFETVTDYSSIMCPTTTPNGLNELTILATQFSESVCSDLAGKERGSNEFRMVLKQHGWENLDIDSIITMTPSGVLVNEATLPKEDNLPHHDLIEGFTEYLSEGPLCGEPVRNVRLNVADFRLASDPTDRFSGQVIPTVRRACSAAHTVAGPRLLEPLYQVVCLGIQQSQGPIENILKSRRGVFHGSDPVRGTNFYQFYGTIPVLDSVGFETQVRGHCHDLVQLSLVFQGWSIVPGDPLDGSIATPKLTKAAAPALSRDLVMKIRKRKGLSREPDLANFLDPEVAQSR